jgi:NAD-dependent dihydropyrimidine dehydrogenase PreA subunit/flavodoxin
MVYHSGSGSTRLVSEVLSDRLSGFFNVDAVEMVPGFKYEKLNDHDLIMLGFPTFYFKPSFSASEFVRKMPVLEKKKPFFLYTTFGLYSGNSIRILSKELEKKNAGIIGYSQIRGPASDGVLILPSFKLFFSYEKKAGEKINRAVNVIRSFFKNGEEKMGIPALRWYSPVTGIFKRQLSSIDYSQYRADLRVMEDRCSNCNICVENCIWGCWKEGKDLPALDISNCEFCLKCVHNCPDKAIIFSDGMKDRSRLDRKFYKKLKDRAFKRI